MYLSSNAEQVGIDLADFGFSNDIKLLGNRLKSLQIESDEDFYILLKTLDAKSVLGFVRVRALLNQLIG